MALVTFMSDFGTEDHYVAAVKASILRVNQSLQIIDLSHSIFPSDLQHASYVLKSVYKDFPKGSVHLCAIDLASRKPSELIAVKLDEHFFVGYDSGLFSLISDQRPNAIISLNALNKTNSTFPAKDVLGPIAAKLACGKDIYEMGPAHDNWNALLPRQLKVTKKEISGNIIRIDHYGNLITNIAQREFDTIMKINGNKPFEVNFGKEKSAKIHQNYHDVESGEFFILFNSIGLLMIGINKGNASELLGLKHDYPVNITFEV